MPTVPDDAAWAEFDKALTAEIADFEQALERAMRSRDEQSADDETDDSSEEEVQECGGEGGKPGPCPEPGSDIEPYTPEREHYHTMRALQMSKQAMQLTKKAAKEIKPYKIARAKAAAQDAQRKAEESMAWLDKHK